MFIDNLVYSISSFPSYDAQNMKYEIGNTKFEIRNSKYEVQKSKNPKIKKHGNTEWVKIHVLISMILEEIS
jgi:hypothetical protein